MIIISVTNLTLRFGTTTILENISFSLDERDKLGIIGVNGCGKSSLFKMITGEYEPTEGEVYLSKGKTLGILTQEGAFAAESEVGNEDDSALDHMYHAFPTLLRDEARLAELEQKLNEGMEAAGGPDAYDILTREFTALNEKFIANGGLEFRGRCLGILRRLGFDDALSHMPVRHLSGGQKTRLALGIQLSREPDVLLLDEPTNHLDIDSREALEEALEGFDGTILTVSHDRYLIDKLATRILMMHPGEAFPGDLLDYTVEHTGEGYTELMRYKTAREAERLTGAVDQGAAVTVISDAKADYLKNKQAAADERKKRNRLQKLREECTRLEDEIAAIEKEMAGEAATDYVRVAELDTKKTELEDKLLSDYEELEELEAWAAAREGTTT